MNQELEILPGKSFPLGATVYPDGVNFCVYSKSCHFVELLLFSNPEDFWPSQTIRLDPHLNRTFYYWHVFIKGAKSGQLYGYRVHGDWDPLNGQLFDKDKILIDPYAKSVYVGKNYSREAAARRGDNGGCSLKNVVVDTADYNWEGDKHLNIPYAETVIYEMHVKGFSKNSNSGLPENIRGTYAGLTEKIPYLKRLGITAVELMPVQQFDEQDAVPPLKNYWGYSPINFFSPHSGYSSDKSPLGPINEFRDMVKALHQAGIEVILDVVFNHTAEGEPDGPIFSFKGFENRSYYILKDNKVDYADYTGCGNTVNANHSVVRRLIRDALRFWVAEMHIDGFRFDLASVLSRDENGKPLENPPILWEIETDPVLAGTKLIAEAWDAAGLYQVGSFVGDKWAEWNGHYRDDVRRFMKGDVDSVAKVAARIIGSPDIYPDPDRKINRSINFITCHDGFTLNDLVTYNKKHNEDNGEKNMDGSDFNFSWNCGVEGPTDDPAINELRQRQMKNFMSILFLSQGTPMILMGDEVMRTQKGNNNAYCQDNEVSWFDWNLVEKNAGMLRFVSGLIQLTQNLHLFRLDTMLKTSYHTRNAHIIWHGVQLGKPDLSHYSHTLAFTVSYPKMKESIHVMVNAYREPLEFEIPLLQHDSQWVQIINTSLKPPYDFSFPEEAGVVDKPAIKLKEYSLVALMSAKIIKGREAAMTYSFPYNTE